MNSIKFNLPIIITRHAALRMVERNISNELLLDIIDTGHTKYSDSHHLWAYKHILERDDNFICAVLVLEDAIVVKTVMHHFEIKD
ncbi:MAG: DUF4258 domain-containing protein [Formosimonas sp.]